MNSRNPQKSPTYAIIDGVLHVSKREAILVENLDEETLEAIMNAPISPRSKALNYLMEDGPKA